MELSGGAMKKMDKITNFCFSMDKISCALFCDQLINVWKLPMSRRVASMALGSGRNTDLTSASEVVLNINSVQI